MKSSEDLKVTILFKKQIKVQIKKITSFNANEK